jgi:hypothetical protein
MYPVPRTPGNKIAMLLLCYVLFNAPLVQAQCIASGPNSPATSSNVPFTGSDYSFSNPLNILANDGNNAVASSILSFSSKQTDYLQAEGFGFNISTAATICGIEVNVVKSAANVLLNLATVTDYNVRVMKNGAPIGTNLADGTTQWSSSDVNTSYGGTNELWGTTWSPTDINSGNFGFSISAEIQGTVALFPSARINFISMTVYYLDPGVLPAQSIQFHVANGTQNTAVLSWKPADMEEAASFAVERSINGTKWEILDGTPQKSAVSHLLTFTDNRPLPGKSFYRLKKMTASGEVRYSTVLSFESTDITSIKCYPNPFTSIIKVTGVVAGEQVAITDIYGKRLYLSSPAINNTIKIDVSDLQPGMYVINTGKKIMKIQKK